MTQGEWNALDQAVQQMNTAERLGLIERLARSLRATSPDTSLVKQQAAIQELHADVAARPVNNPSDGFSVRDHDRVAYGDAS